MERIERHDFPFVIYNCQGTRRDQNHFRMADGVFESIRGSHGKGREATACNPLSNPLDVHAETLLIGFDTVNRVGFATRAYSILNFYMGKNTPERKDYIMRKLVVPVEE